MLIDVLRFDFSPAADTARRVAIERERSEVERKAKGWPVFANCPTCAVPPTPVGNMTITGGQKGRPVYGITGQTLGYEVRGPKQKTWEFKCKCGTRLKYESMGEDGAHLVDWQREPEVLF